MAHYKDVIRDLLKPEDKLGSVIDTFNCIGEILEIRQKAAKGEYFSKEDADKLIMRGMYVLGFFPFYHAHGAVMRPILLDALESDDPIEDFFVKAIPAALTIAMPAKQEEYYKLREVVRQKFKE